MKKRDRVYHKFGGLCAYCGDPIKRDELCVDHIKPLFDGGESDISNLNPSCRKCNSIKQNLSIEDFRLRLAYRERFTDLKFSINQIKWLIMHTNFERAVKPKNVTFYFESIEA